MHEALTSGTNRSKTMCNTVSQTYIKTFDYALELCEL